MEVCDYSLMIAVRPPEVLLLPTCSYRGKQFGLAMGNEKSVSQLISERNTCRPEFPMILPRQYTQRFCILFVYSNPRSSIQQTTAANRTLLTKDSIKFTARDIHYHLVIFRKKPKRNCCFLPFYEEPVDTIPARILFFKILPRELKCRYKNLSFNFFSLSSRFRALCLVPTRPRRQETI